MKKRKIKIGVLLGGKSAEHQVSLSSAKNVIEGLDKEKYEVVPIGIEKDGRWYLFDKNNYLLNANNPKLIKLNKSKKEIKIFGKNQIEEKFDVIFPVLHGPYGEDGSIQGFLKLIGIPFVGAGVLGSALGMDKDIMKKVLREANIPIGKFLTYRLSEKINSKEVVKKLGLPLFVKPANMGSSVGINKVKNILELEKAIKEAFKYDVKIVIEGEIKGREIECAVLGNEHPKASLPGEVLATKDFYSYDAKYINDSALLYAPVKLSTSTTKKIQELAIKVFKALNCEGLGRVDMFLLEDGNLIVNEINTLPGFTSISMYPKLWEVSGIPLSRLLDELVSLALLKHKKESKIKVTV